MSNQQKETAEEKRRRTTCRACSNGWGDGICGRHAHKFRVAIKQIEARTTRTGKIKS